MDSVCESSSSSFCGPNSVHAGTVRLLWADKRLSLIALMTQCPVSYPLLTGHTCIGPQQRIILSPILLPLSPSRNSDLHHLRNQSGYSGSWAAGFVYSLFFLFLHCVWPRTDTWWVISPAHPQAQRKSPSFSSCFKQTAPPLYQRECVWKLFRTRFCLLFVFQRHFAKLACPFVALLWMIRHCAQCFTLSIYK